MQIKAQTRKRILSWCGITLLGGIIGVSYSLWVGGNPGLAFTAACILTGAVFGFELFYVYRPAGIWLRSLPLPLFLAISSLIWIIIVGTSLQVVPLFFGFDQAYGDTYSASTFTQDMSFALIIIFIVNSVLRIRSLIGSRVLKNFMIGRYHRPLREQRVFMFLDLANSTPLSEELGDIRVQSLIGRFFFDIAQPIAEYGGETHSYIGDEVVVTWSLTEATKDNRCIECVFAIQSTIARLAVEYQSEFGVIPEFRIGMHGGSVVASEVGDDKREIVYFGDTINTAARLQGLCKEKHTNFLISDHLLNLLPSSDLHQKQYMGEVELRGKSKLMKVYSLVRN